MWRWLIAAALASAALPAAAFELPPMNEPIAKLRSLLQLDTTNPPGQEVHAAALVASWFEAEGIPVTFYESAPGRVNVVARLQGDGSEKPLLLLNHLDVVTAEPSAWTYPPFEGKIAEGAIWGRGALDMKGLGVMQAMAFLSLKRRGVPLRRDVIFCATADEEAGGAYGAEWMLKHHREAIDASEVLNEGGAGLATPTGKAVMGIQTAERGVLWIKVTAKGEPGHGSQDRPDGATRRLVRALARLEAAPRHRALIPETRAMLESLAETETGVRSWALKGLAQPWLMPLLAPRVTALEPRLATILGDTLNTTVLAAGAKVNVMPGSASAELDMRLLPGRSPEAALAEVREALGDPELTLEVLHGRAGTVTRERGSLYQALEAVTRAEYPGAVVMPVMTPGGGTDSAFFREAGIAAYGFMPIVATTAQLASMHGDNEYLTLEQLERGTRVLTKAVEAAARKH